MKLKKKVKSLDEVQEQYRDLYVEKDGEFILEVDGEEDTGALKRAKDHEKKRRQDAEQKARDLEEQMADIQEQLDALQDKGGDKDTSGIEKKWQDKYSKREKELTDQIDSLGKEINTLLIDNVADQIAADLSDSPAVLRPHVRQRLTVERVDGKAVTRVKDLDGELSAMTLDELKSEFQSNNDFASVIRGSKGSGSGASGGQGGQGGKPQKPDFTKATPKEKAAYLKAQKEAGA